MQTTLPKAYFYSIIRTSIVLFACGALLTAAGFYFAHREQAASYADSFTLLASLNRGIAHRALILFFLILASSVAAISVAAVLWSHRLAGPLHRLGLQARRIASGDLTGSVRLRDTDVVHTLADELNGLSARYRGLLAELERKTRELALVMEAAEKQAPGEGTAAPPREIPERIDELKALLEQLKL